MASAPGTASFKSRTLEASAGSGSQPLLLSAVCTISKRYYLIYKPFNRGHAISDLLALAAVLDQYENVLRCVRDDLLAIHRVLRRLLPLKGHLKPRRAIDIRTAGQRILLAMAIGSVRRIGEICIRA